MYALLHGYYLEGSGSNLWTRYMARSLSEIGETFLLGALENHPEKFDFIAEAFEASPEGEILPLFKRETPYAGCCKFLRLPRGDFLPTYVAPYQSQASQMIAMVDLSDEQIESYLSMHQRVLEQAISKFGLTALNTNHAVLLSVVAQRLQESMQVPFTITPHGSALEYAVKADPRYYQLAQKAFQAAGKIFCVGGEIKRRLGKIFPKIPGLENKFADLGLGVDTQTFRSLARSKRKAKIRVLIQEIAGQWESMSPISRPFPEATQLLEQIDWEQEKIILHVGALLPNKGLPVLLGAMPEILTQEPQARLLVVGKGPLLEELREQAKDFKDRVLFLGYFPHHLVSGLFPCADVGVFPSLIPEAGPLVFLEALASGCLPLGTNLGGMSEFFRVLEQTLSGEDVDNMRLNPIASQMLGELTHKVPWALNRSPELRETLAEIAQKSFDWRGKARILSTVLRDLGA